MSFAPIQARFCEGEMTRHYKTYAANLAFVDPIRIKSEYAIICDIGGCDASSALGGAIRSIDKACRLLSFVRLEDGQKHRKRDRLPFEPYVNQVNNRSRCSITDAYICLIDPSGVIGLTVNQINYYKIYLRCTTNHLRER